MCLYVYVYVYVCASCVCLWVPLVDVQEEWVKDSKGMPAMTGPLFYDAVFELIGTWHGGVRGE